MKYIQTQEKFLSKVKNFIKDKLKEQEVDYSKNITGSPENRDKLIDFIKDTLIYLQDDFTIKVNTYEGSTERGNKGEVVFGELKSEVRVEVQKQVRSGDENSIEDNLFTIDDIRNELLTMVDLITRNYNVIDVFFVYRGKRSQFGDDNLFTQTTGVRIDATIAGKPITLNRDDFEKISYDTITSEVNVIFKIL